MSREHDTGTPSRINTASVPSLLRPYVVDGAETRRRDPSDPSWRGCESSKRTSSSVGTMVSVRAIQ